MKSFVSLLCFLLCFVFCLDAQDLIVTTQKDSLNCKIKQQDKSNVYFLYKKGDVVGDSLLPKTQVKFLQINYFSYTEVDPGIAEQATVEVQAFSKNESFYFFVDGGWGYRSGEAIKTDLPGMDNYLEKLRSGFCIKIGWHYYWNKFYGMGMEYALFKASASEEKMIIPDKGVGNIEDNTFIHYIGPTFNAMSPTRRGRNAWILSGGIGYLGYKDRAIVNTPMEIKGSTVGVNIALGYDIRLADKIAMGIKFTSMVGVLGKAKFISTFHSETINLDKKENLSYISLTLGFRLIAQSKKKGA